jgi:hypothetical protein
LQDNLNTLLAASDLAREPTRKELNFVFQRTNLIASGQMSIGTMQAQGYS